MMVERWLTQAAKLALLDVLARSVMLYAISTWGATKMLRYDQGNLPKGVKELATLYNTGIR